MMYGNWNGIGCSGGMFGFWKILLIIGLIVLVVALIMSWRNNRNNQNLMLTNNQAVQNATYENPTTVNDNSVALEKLKMMYATGEITEEEYLKRKAVIERG